MESVGKAAIESAKEWLKSAMLNREHNNYAKSLYDLQMALEIAQKGVLLALGKNFPKKHEIGTLFRQVVNVNENKLPKELNDSVEEIETIFNELLELRSASGYGFESGIDKEEFKLLSQKYYDKTVNAVKLCEQAVNSINKK